MPIAVLLVAPEPAATVLAQALREETNVDVQQVSTARASLPALRRDRVDLIVLEENLALAETDATQAIYAAAPATPVLEINFGTCGGTRRFDRSGLRSPAGGQIKPRLAESPQ